MDFLYSVADVPWSQRAQKGAVIDSLRCYLQEHLPRSFQLDLGAQGMKTAHLDDTKGLVVQEFIAPQLDLCLLKRVLGDAVKVMLHERLEQ